MRQIMYDAADVVVDIDKNDHVVLGLPKKDIGDAATYEVGDVVVNAGGEE